MKKTDDKNKSSFSSSPLKSQELFIAKVLSSIICGEVKKAINGKTAPILINSATEPKTIRIEMKTNLTFLSLSRTCQNFFKLTYIT
tara:strand:- start:158 stop:415 length:258 start_codon:yes stop_codon:yes gene_type:complete